MLLHDHDHDHNQILPHHTTTTMTTTNHYHTITPMTHMTTTRPPKSGYGSLPPTNSTPWAISPTVTHKLVGAHATTSSTAPLCLLFLVPFLPSSSPSSLPPLPPLPSCLFLSLFVSHYAANHRFGPCRQDPTGASLCGESPLGIGSAHSRYLIGNLASACL